ncbi:MAG TPA: hypothetical protein PLU87_06915 [Sedimentisphaerales bacterium]|nr:hypothetical protein [Sedimentisphaerales bacterium]HRS10581.1 hypothetical protein [Sedimentisphaerales bacterium]HRV47195.1 hypothetical protein [Sedimentisphaerales bacterium]
MGRTHFSAMCALSLVLVAFHTSSALAKVWARVCLADEVTPLALADPNVPEVYRDIMVGTRLTIFITSDTAERWDGALWLSQENWARGGLSARGYDQQSRNYRGSCLEAAGNLSAVNIRVNSSGLKFDLFCGPTAGAGEWFILDYTSSAVGTCNIGLYAFDVGDNIAINPDPWIDDPPPFEANLIQVLSFRHVPSRDFNGDTLVNFVDYACLAGLWGQSVASEPNAPVAPDLNADGRVDVQDVGLFGEYWLERTEVVRPAPEPAEMDSMP